MTTRQVGDSTRIISIVPRLFIHHDLISGMIDPGIKALGRIVTNIIVHLKIGLNNLNQDKVWRSRIIHNAGNIKGSIIFPRTFSRCIGSGLVVEPTKLIEFGGTAVVVWNDTMLSCMKRKSGSTVTMQTNLLKAHLGCLTGPEGNSHDPGLVCIFISSHARMSQVQVVPEE